MDVEEAKGQEVAKLQSALEEMQGQLDEANAAIICEREAAKLAIEQAPPVIKEVPVVDETKLKLLSNHNEELEVTWEGRTQPASWKYHFFCCIWLKLNFQVEVGELKKKIEEFEEKFAEVENESKARLKEAEEAQLKAMQLQETIER